MSKGAFTAHTFCSLRSTRTALLERQKQAPAPDPGASTIYMKKPAALLCEWQVMMLHDSDMDGMACSSVATVCCLHTLINFTDLPHTP